MWGREALSFSAEVPKLDLNWSTLTRDLSGISPMKFLRLIQTNSLTPSVHPGLEFDFAAEARVDEDNIADSKSHAEEPPGETDREGVRAGDGSGEGDVAIGACGGRKERGIKSPAGTGEHEEEIKAGGEKSFDGLEFAVEEPYAGHGCDHPDGDYESKRIAEVVVKACRADDDGGDEANDGQG